MDIDEALLVLWREIGRSSQRRVAAEIGIAASTITGWRNNTRIEGKSREKLLEWAQELPPEAAPLPPVAKPTDYWRGVLYAASAMSETVSKLTREAAEAWATPAELDRQHRDEGGKGGKGGKTQAPQSSTPEVWLTTEEIDADMAAGEVVEQQKAKQKHGKRRSAASE